MAGATLSGRRVGASGTHPLSCRARSLSTCHYSPSTSKNHSPSSDPSHPPAQPAHQTTADHQQHLSPLTSHLSPPPPPPPAASSQQPARRDSPAVSGTGTGAVSRPRRRQALNLAGKACSSSSPNHRPRCPSDLLIFTNTSSTLPMLRRLHSLPRAPHSCLPQPAGVTIITETRRRFTPRPLRRTSDLPPSLSEECICVVSLVITSFLFENRKAVRAREVGEKESQDRPVFAHRKIVSFPKILAKTRALASHTSQ